MIWALHVLSLLFAYPRMYVFCLELRPRAAKHDTSHASPNPADSMRVCFCPCPHLSSFRTTRELRRKDATGLGFAALANGCAHRALTRRAKELGAPELPTMGWNTGRKDMMKHVEARLNGHGDVEDGECSGHERSDHPLEFYRIKPGSRHISLGTGGSSSSWLPRRNDGAEAEIGRAIKFAVLVSVFYGLCCLVVGLAGVCLEPTFLSYRTV